MAETNAVILSDGRTATFGVRQKCKKEIISETQIRFDYKNGEVLVFDLSKVDAATLRNLGLHGAKQKIGDEGADEDSADSYHAQCKAMIERLYAGTGFERMGGGGFQDTVLIEALMKVSGMSREDVAAQLKGCSAEEKAALRQMPEVAEAIAAVEKTRGAGVDAGAVAAKFGLVR